MSTMYRYAMPVDATSWTIGKQDESAFSWEYEDGKRELLDLYDKGKRQQWDAARRLDWSIALDPENPQPHCKGWKNARISRASASGCSSAAKWPPLCITLQRRMSNTRSAAARGGRSISCGKSQ